MPREKIDTYETDTTPSIEIVRAYREAYDRDDNNLSLAILHYRGGQPEFDLGKHYSLSRDSIDRQIGAQILGQLGWSDDCFHDESVALLVPLLSDPDAGVIASAGIALGHRNSKLGIPALLFLIKNPDPEVRFWTVHGLTGHDDPAAINGLIQLTQDESADVRNWSAFGLGTISDADSQEVRNALFSMLDDVSDEARGEALVGLAKRQDPRVLQPLIRELKGKFCGSWCVEAAEQLGDPQLKPLLISLRKRVPLEDMIQFMPDFEAAIAACTR